MISEKARNEWSFLAFLVKEKVDTMVVFHVSTFILQLHTAGGYDYRTIYKYNCRMILWNAVLLRGCLWISLLK